MPPGTFSFFELTESGACVEAVARLCKNWIPAQWGKETEFQVLAPMHKGIVGIQNLKPGVTGQPQSPSGRDPSATTGSAATLSRR